MSKIKDYFIYTIFILFTIISSYQLIDSFIHPDIELNDSLLFKDRLKQLNGIVLFGGLGLIYFLIKENKFNPNKNSIKTFIIMFFGCLIFVISSLFLILYPEEFRRGNKFVKIIIGYSGILFFGTGLIMSVYKLIKEIFKPNKY
ncbi:hypothetical protein OA93_01775 [Flavobacterium sp. KMS]|uniref:hypothetical protein n=1 Tax=Flavobacterium sp. KMS TaxID=1566023 RepID=UPI0005801058|nr:hypothetical protein [Flavobacterium sp. KMS]KIC00355.1 hypothetical protein OA93_01775 [Flavobacterium sp. KMS]